MTATLETGWLPQTPVEDSLLRRFVHNQIDAQEEQARALDGRADRTDDVGLSDLGLPAAMLNMAMLRRPLAGADDPVLDVVDDFYRGRPGALFSAWPTPDLSGRGWALIGHPMFVARGPWGVGARPSPGVEVQIATSAADLAVAERIAVEGYPMPELAGLPPNALFSARMLAGGVVHRVGLLDGVPVAAAASHVAHGVVNLCFAATLPAARRRGVWQALVEARCAAAPDLPAVAFTSDDSRPGFVRLGFLPVQRATFWAVVSR
jgi:GNAT superfamily N-acetyltransferase